MRKLNFKIRLAHFSLLAFILSVGGGILTGILEMLNILRFSNSYNFADRFPENWFETLVYDLGSRGWAIIFFVAFIPFTFLFLISTAVAKKVIKRNTLR